MVAVAVAEAALHRRGEQGGEGYLLPPVSVNLGSEERVGLVVSRKQLSQCLGHSAEPVCGREGE